MRHTFCQLLLAALIASAPVAATARIPAEKLRALDIGGFRLGMTSAEVEAALHAGTDLGEVRATLAESFDCDDLYPDESRDRDAPEKRGQAIEEYYVEGVGGRWHSIGMDIGPDGQRAGEITFRDMRPSGPWRRFLAEAEAEFGKADLVQPGRERNMVAIWCASDAEPCNSDGEGLSLRLEWMPYSEGSVFKGDSLDYTLVEGRAVRNAREADWWSLAVRDPKGAAQLFARCRKQSGYDDRSAERAMALLAGSLAAARPPVWRWDRVPVPVFKAIRIDPAQQFAAGTCFSSFDVIFDTPGCDSFTFTRFRWARRLGDMWIVALERGGSTLREQYFAVRREKGGAYRKVWWDTTLATLANWRANGARGDGA